MLSGMLSAYSTQPYPGGFPSYEFPEYDFSGLTTGAAAPYISNLAKYTGGWQPEGYQPAMDFYKNMLTTTPGGYDPAMTYYQDIMSAPYREEAEEYFEPFRTEFYGEHVPGSLSYTMEGMFGRSREHDLMKERTIRNFEEGIRTGMLDYIMAGRQQGLTAAQAMANLGLGVRGQQLTGAGQMTDLGMLPAETELAVLPSLIAYSQEPERMALQAKMGTDQAKYQEWLRTETAKYQDWMRTQDISPFASLASQYLNVPTQAGYIVPGQAPWGTELIAAASPILGGWLQGRQLSSILKG